MHLRDHNLSSEFEMHTLEAIGRSGTPTASFESVIAISDSRDLSIASACEGDTCEHAHLFLDATPSREIAITNLPPIASWLRYAFRS